MKLKYLMSSIVAIGLCSPAFAALFSNQPQAVQKPDVTMPLSYKPHRHACFPTLFKVCAKSKADLILDDLTQNIGRALHNPCRPDWFHRIGLSGGVNLDVGKWGNRNIGYAGENTNIVSLNDAYLNISGLINDFTQVLIGLSYINVSNFYSIAYTTGPDSLIVGDLNNKISMQQAYIHLGNFDYSPIFLEFGQQFQDYGRYEIHPITESLTQTLTETLRTAGKIGFVTDLGLHGSAAIFQNPIPKTSIGGSRSFDYIGALGFKRQDCGVAYDIGAAYMYDIQGVNLIGNTAALRAGVPPQDGIYHLRVGAVAAYADAAFQPFSFSLRYTVALQEFSVLDLPLDDENPDEGAKPWAAGAQMGYSFAPFCLNQNIYLGYQVSRETVNLNLPRARWLIGYGVYPMRNTTITAEWDHDIAYPVAEGGPGEGNSNLVTLRFAIKFG